MLEQDLTALDARETRRLEQLETDIWRRERIIASAKRFLASGQAVILCIAILVSAAVGIMIATRAAPPTLSHEESLAPSHLLLGTKP
jgi:hypothetical protein